MARAGLRDPFGFRCARAEHAEPLISELRCSGISPADTLPVPSALRKVSTRRERASPRLRFCKGQMLAAPCAVYARFRTLRHSGNLRKAGSTREAWSAIVATYQRRCARKSGRERSRESRARDRKPVARIRLPAIHFIQQARGRDQFMARPPIKFARGTEDIRTAQEPAAEIPRDSLFELSSHRDAAEQLECRDT